jgi:hypothetical protein
MRYPLVLPDLLGRMGRVIAAVAEDRERTREANAAVERAGAEDAGRRSLDSLSLSRGLDAPSGDLNWMGLSRIEDNSDRK